MNKAWREGAPVGSGWAYIPDAKTARAYAEACKAAQVEAAAEHALTLPTLEARRAFIHTQPAQRIEAVKARIASLWAAR